MISAEWQSLGNGAAILTDGCTQGLPSTLPSSHVLRYVVVVEHDLSVLDYLSDFICCLYGVPGAYGVVTMPFSVKEGKSTAKSVCPSLSPGLIFAAKL